MFLKINNDVPAGKSIYCDIRMPQVDVGCRHKGLIIPTPPAVSQKIDSC